MNASLVKAPWSGWEVGDTVMACGKPPKMTIVALAYGEDGYEVCECEWWPDGARRARRQAFVPDRLTDARDG